jgi:hypothetical protein
MTRPNSFGTYVIRGGNYVLVYVTVTFRIVLFLWPSAGRRWWLR